MSKVNFTKNRIEGIYNTENNKLFTYKTKYYQISSQNNKCVIRRDDDIKDSDLELMELSRFIQELEPTVETLKILNDLLLCNMETSSKLILIKNMKCQKNIDNFIRCYPELIDMCEQALTDGSKL